MMYSNTSQKNILQHLLIVTALSVALLTTACQRWLSPRDRVRELTTVATAHRQAGEYTAAEAAYEAAIAMVEDDNDLLLRLAELYLIWQRPQQGLSILAQLPPAVMEASTEAQRLQLQLLAADGAWPEAISAASQVLAECPTEPVAWQVLIEAYLALNKCDQALDAANRALSLSDAPPPVLETAQLLAGDYAALAETSPTLTAGTESCAGDCDFAMGLRLVRLRRWGSAACVLGRALAQASPGSEATWIPEAHAWIGEAMVQLGLEREAQTQLRRAVELAPQSALAWLLLGKSALMQGDFETARIALYNAHQFDPESPAPCLAMAELQAAQGRYGDAEPWIDAALERAPAEASIWVSAARFYLARDLAAPTRLEEITQHALALAPDDPEVLVVAGWHWLNSDRPEDALELLDRAVEIAPGFAEAHYLRGMALRATGAAVEATAALTRAADLGETRAQR
ncbi:MAG: tetratricopeptide repeat protein [Anaerolineae bacterium]|nr:tetratricopeptide repeat protein [Anaerolineae bacterium]